MTEPIAVRVRDCECPGQPHTDTGDIVYLAPKLSLAGGLAADFDIRKAAGDGTFLAQLWQVTFVKYGAVGWNFVDADGPLDFDVDALLEDYTLAQPVAEAADDLYGEAVMRPLVARLKAISPRGRTNGSTSATRPSTSKPHARSSRSTSAASVPSTP